MKDKIRELANALVKVEHLAQIEGVWAFSSYDGITKVHIARSVEDLQEILKKEVM